VLNVNKLNRPGKRKRNRGEFSFGRQASRTHAMVKLSPGDTIPIFEGV